MFLKKIGVVCGLCVLFSACSSPVTFSDQYAMKGSAADKGVRYLLGRGVTQNNEKAFYYFSQAANEDDPFAQNELAYLYAAGKGTRRDYAKALSYYKKAADHGLASAQYNLGLMYDYGLGTLPDRSLARQWFQKSAALGFEPATKMLAHYRS